MSSAKWKSGIDDELAFWRNWVATGGGAWSEDFAQRLDPNLPLKPEFATLLTPRPFRPLRILDVGAGPLTVLGKIAHGRRLRITATDALAEEYAEILAEYGIKPIVPTIYCTGEELLTRFRKGAFDMSFCRNALDHTVNPPLVVSNMLELVRKGGWVVLKHFENEAKFEEYRGLHQWNIEKHGDDVRIKSDSVDVSMREAYSGRAEMSVDYEEVDGNGRHMISVYLRRR